MRAPGRTNRCNRHAAVHFADRWAPSRQDIRAFFVIPVENTLILPEMRNPRVFSVRPVLMIACASIALGTVPGAMAGTAPPVAAARTSPELRLALVGYRIATANPGLCPKPQMMTGLILHELGAYAARYRVAVTADLGLTYGFGIRVIVPESAAARAGLQERDEIMAVNGEDLRSFGADLTTDDASYDRTERFHDLLDTELHKGPARLTIRRGASLLSIALHGDAGCGGRMALMPERSLNAWSDGRYVGLTTRMMEFVQDDSELAFVVAHEMSHNMLGHDRTRGVGNPLVHFGIGAGEIKATELQADIQAVRLMAASGYDPTASERFLERLGKAKILRIATTHPGTSRRIAAVRAEMATLANESKGPAAARP